MKTPCLILALFVSVATALAVDPPPDGGYPNGNTAEGDNALFSLTTGVQNTAIGFEALYSDVSGTLNTANGWGALHDNDGSFNTGTGAFVLYSNTTGVHNTATGQAALYSNTTGHFNSAYGSDALFYNTTGNSNTATGISALFNNTTGRLNTANGAEALEGNTSGDFNTAIGQDALSNNSTGRSNIALGFNAGLNLTTGSNNIDIGNKGVAGESNTIRIGIKGTQTTTRIAGISGVTVAGGVGVIIDTNGQLGTVTSSARYKENIRPTAKSSEAILSLKPVQFRYKKELDPQVIPQFGLVAEDVAKVDPDLVARDEQGKPYTVRYEAVNAMLLNEFLKEHKKVEEQASEIAELKSALTQQATRMDEVTARLSAKGL